MMFSIIAAMDKNRGIGKNGSLPWRLSGDMQHFREVTTQSRLGLQNAVIMGRATWKSLPVAFKPLPDRINMVLSRSIGDYGYLDVLWKTSFSDALTALEDRPVDKIFVIGGESVYAQTITHSQCQRLYLTEIDSVCDCDTFFPKIPKDFVKISESKSVVEGIFSYRFVVYERDI